ncbi:MAG TPA: hypothetical protein VF138_12350 [Caulobacteraceae bacterium]
MRGVIAAVLLGALATAACSPAIKGLDEDVLHDEVSQAIGDANTCVLLATADGKVAWRYNTHITCARTLPDCAGGTTNVEDLAKAAAKGDERTVSCPSVEPNTVAWATGKVAAGKGADHPPLFYAAVMEGERALPGREIAARLDTAFADAGL